MGLCWLLLLSSCFVLTLAFQLPALKYDGKGRRAALWAKVKKSNQKSALKTQEPFDEDDGFLLGDEEAGELEIEDEDGVRDGELDEDEDGVVSSIDDIEDLEEADSSLSGVSVVANDAWQASVKEVVLESLGSQGLDLRKLAFLPARIEVVAVGRPGPTDEKKDDDEYIIPSIDAISAAHRDMYVRFEAREAELDVVARFELAVASPGIGSFLRTGRDFETFRGFPVVVTVKEEYKKKRQFEGTLVDRDDENVQLSLKGRIVKIPRTLVDTVSLPKARYESTDSEMRKLR